MNSPDVIYADSDLVCGESPKFGHEKYVRAAIETEIARKWAIGTQPVFGSGSIKDIQTLCGECERLRKHNEDLVSALQLAADQIDYAVSSMAKGHTVSMSSLQNCAASARLTLSRAKGESTP